MSNHLKRLVAPGSWHISRKTRKFIAKTSPGPHNASAMPVSVWLRDHTGLARNQKEAKKIIQDRAVIVNGMPARDSHIGIGVFDIISIPKMGRHYRILMNKKGRLATIEISEEDAQSRLCKIRDKTIIRGGKVQLNLLYGANIIGDNSYSPRDSIVVKLTGDDRLKIIDHYPFAVGNMAMIIGGGHSGKIGKITEIRETPGSVPNRVFLEEMGSGESFDTIDDYVFMVGRETTPVTWGIE